jgi:hypothetical protein
MAKIAEQIELVDKIKPLLAGHDPEPPIRPKFSLRTT